jgi:hypothetical protein
MAVRERRAPVLKDPLEKTLGETGLFERQCLQESAGPPEELRALVASEVTKWAKVIKAARIPLQ